MDKTNGKRKKLHRIKVDRADFDRVLQLLRYIDGLIYGDGEKGIFCLAGSDACKDAKNILKDNNIKFSVDE